MSVYATETPIPDGIAPRSTPTLGHPTGSPPIAAQTPQKSTLGRRAAYLRDVPPLYRGVVIRAFAGHSRTAAIKACCLDCCGFVRAEVAACPVILCPLHPYRPYQQGEAEEDAE